MEKNQINIIILTLLLFLFIPKPIVICSDGCAFLISTNILHTLLGITTLLSGFLGQLTGPNEFNILYLVFIVYINIPIVYLCYKFSKFVVLFNKNKSENSKKHHLLRTIGIILIYCLPFIFLLFMAREETTEYDNKKLSEIAIRKLDTAEDVNSAAYKCKFVSANNNEQCLINLMEKVNNIDYCDKKLYEEFYLNGIPSKDTTGLDIHQYNCRMRFIEKEKDITLCEKYMNSDSDRDKCINTVKNLSAIQK